LHQNHSCSMLTYHHVTFAVKFCNQNWSVDHHVLGKHTSVLSTSIQKSCAQFDVLKKINQLHLAVTGMGRETDAMSCLNPAVVLQTLTWHANWKSSWPFKYVCHACYRLLSTKHETQLKIQRKNTTSNCFQKHAHSKALPCL
jgi:hypothetical protein